MKVSYGLTVCNEHEEIKNLLEFLNKYIDADDEIVVVYDGNRFTVEVMMVLSSFKRANYSYHPFNFQQNFLENKNYMNSLCTGDYIFQLDADEIPHTNLITNLKQVLEFNPVDLIITPRKNTVHGLGQQHIDAWKWNVTKDGWVNWPDNQKRIYKNDSKIKWTGHQVHGMVTGYNNYAALPEEEEWCIEHIKTIDRQASQNARYAYIEQTIK